MTEHESSSERRKDIVRKASLQAGMPSEAGWHGMPEELRNITHRFAQMHLEAQLNPLEAGRMLLQAKELLGHGHFLKWLNDYFSMSSKSANRLMSVALMFQRLSLPENAARLLLQLDASALYELAAKSTHKDVQTKVLSLLELGHTVTYSDIRLLKSQIRSSFRASTSHNDSLMYRTMGLLESFNAWFERYRVHLLKHQQALDPMSRQELETAIFRLKEACMLLETILEQDGQQDGPEQDFAEHLPELAEELD